MSAYLSPLGGAGWQFFTNAGAVLAGGKLYTYIAGSTTAKSTWTDSTQGTANANPIILDSYGRLTSEVWLESGANNYKFILKDSTDVTIGTWDNITGIAASNALQSEWVASGLAVTYASITSFTVPGDQTAIFVGGRRLQYFIGAGTKYGSVVSSSVALGITTVVITPDVTNLDVTLSSVSYGFLHPTSFSVPAQYLREGEAIDNTIIGQATPAYGRFTNLISSNVALTGGTITGITGFSVPDFLLINQGVI